MLSYSAVGRQVWIEASKSTRTRQSYVLLQLSPFKPPSNLPRSLARNAYRTRHYATVPSPPTGHEATTRLEPPPSNLAKKPKLDLHPAPKKFPSPSENGRPPSLVTTPSQQTSLNGTSHPLTSTQTTPSLGASLDTNVATSSHPWPYPISASAIQTAMEDLRKAEQHGVFTPPPEGAGRVGKGWHQLKQLAKFYFKGLKLLWVHRKTVVDIQRRLSEEAKDGKPAQMTRWETQFVRTYQQDRVKLVPFLLILIILEEALPLVALYMPSLLPSTCVLPSQRERMDEKAENNKRLAIVDIKRWLQHKNDRALRAVDRNLSALDAELYRPICRMFAVAGWGPTILRRQRLNKHLAYLAEDDTLLEREGSGSRLNELELRWALRERGFLTKNLQDTELRPLLAKWLDLTAKEGRIAAAVCYAEKAEA